MVALLTECSVHKCETLYQGMQYSNRGFSVLIYRCYAGNHNILVAENKVITDVQEQAELLR